jgi:formylglycine-generating enzyme required for sulfatase activity
MFPFTVRHPIPPVVLAPGIAMRFEVIPPVPVQEAALASSQPLSFMMGSRDGLDIESPRHRVVIPQPFYLGTFPVTQREFACFRPEHRNAFPGNPDHPAESLSWDDARDFLAWLAKEARNLPRGFVPRLPCEAEWEYACRAGTDTEYHSGDGEAALEEVGWYDGNSGETTHPVGLKPGNAWGLHDMHGNVWEWCGDVYDSRAYTKRGQPWLGEGWSQADTSEDTEHDDFVPHLGVRGGAWINYPDSCRAASRNGWLPGDRLWSLGFRVLLSPPPFVDAHTLPT